MDERDVRLKRADSRPGLVGRERIDDLKTHLRCSTRRAVRDEVRRAMRRRPCTARQQADIVSGRREARTDQVGVRFRPSGPRHPVRHEQDAQALGHQGTTTGMFR